MSDELDPQFGRKDRCDRCGLPFHGWANAYGHGTVCNRCESEMHAAYPEHGVRGYPAHQLDQS